MTYNGNCDGFLLIYSILNYFSYYVSVRECKAQLGFKKIRFLGSIPDPTRDPKFRGGAGRVGLSWLQVFSGQGPERGQKLGAGRGLKIRVFWPPYYLPRFGYVVFEYSLSIF